MEKNVQIAIEKNSRRGGILIWFYFPHRDKILVITIGTQQSKNYNNLFSIVRTITSGVSVVGISWGSNSGSVISLHL